MRRIALTAALVATLAGGAAALAATPDAGAPDSPPPDPYQGAWALTIDGRFAGAVGQVQGCGLAAQIVGEAGPDHHKHLASPAPEACTFQVGQGMTPDFYNLVNDGLAAVPATHKIELVRTDAAGRYGLALDHALLRSIALPKVDRAATAPVFLDVAVAGERITRDPAPRPAGGKPLPLNGFDPATLKVGLAGLDLGASAAGPWSAAVKPAVDQTGVVRESQVVATSTDIGDLGLRVPENSKAMTRTLDPWVQKALVNGDADAEQPVSVSLGGLTLTLDHAAPQRADLVPRADGARSYSLYTEHVVLAGS